MPFQELLDPDCLGSQTHPRRGFSARSFPTFSVAVMLVLGLALPSEPQAQTVPSNADLRTSANSARQSGDLKRAMELYQQALQSTPDWREGWWFLGNLQYQTDNYVQASASLGRYLALSPDAPAALALRGLSEFESGNLTESLADIQHALALGAANQPRNGQILLYHEALLLTAAGRFDEAVAKYILFVKQGTVNDDIALGLGLAGLRVAMLPGSADPTQRQVAVEAGQAAIKILTGDVAGGREGFRAVLQAHPETQFVHYFCGYLLFTSSPDLAMEEFRLELEASPRNALAHSMLAWAAEFRGEYAAALSDARAAVVDDPALPMSQLVLGRALVETDDAAGALPHLDQVAIADPSNLEAHLSLAKAYSKLGRKDDARRERLLCLDLSSQVPGGGKAADANR